MLPRWRFVTPGEGGEDRNTLENMAATIRDQVTLTNRLLQRLDEYGTRNGNGNGHGAANGDIPGLNPHVLGLTEFKKM